MAVVLPQGTKEYLLFDVTDELGTIVTLSGHNPRYTVYDPSNIAKYTDQAATFTLMTAYCMIDTTTGGPWPDGEYEIYLRLDATPEIPLIGPKKFQIITVPEP